MCTNLYVNAEDVFKFLNSHDHELMLDHLDEIQKQSALQEAEEPELSLNDRTIKSFKAEWGLWPNETGIKMSEVTGLNE